ncbi:MAG: hypothetical protein JO102_05350 [Elusimicrobia bacterium]|nr:hypothetical protein [Elusimicrobiota bacterium]
MDSPTAFRYHPVIVITRRQMTTFPLRFPSFHRRCRRAFFAAAIVVGAAAAMGSRHARAEMIESEAFPYRIDPSALDVLNKGVNATIYFERQIPALFRSDKAIDAVNASTISAHILMLGKYHSPRGNCDLALHGEVKQGTVEIEFPLGRVDAALFEWEEQAARPEALKALRPVVENLSFDEAIGFHAVYSLKRDFEYQLAAEIPYNPVTKNLMPSRPSFKDTASFIKALEGDSRARVILSNNATGLPNYVRAEDAANTLSAGYLMNNIKYDRRIGRYDYTYTDELKKLKSLSEVRTLLKDPNVKAFTGGAENFRLKVTGSEKTGFSFVLTGEGDRRLEGTLIGRRVVVKGAPVAH